MSLLHAYIKNPTGNLKNCREYMQVAGNPQIKIQVNYYPQYFRILTKLKITG